MASTLHRLPLLFDVLTGRSGHTLPTARLLGEPCWGHRPVQNRSGSTTWRVDPPMVSPMAAPPVLTDAQRKAALLKAAEARRIRADLKERLKMGSVTLTEVLQQASADEIVGKTKVLAVLESLPGVGKVKARRLMEDIGIAESRRLRGLGDQQRAALLESFS